LRLYGERIDPGAFDVDPYRLLAEEPRDRTAVCCNQVWNAPSSVDLKEPVADLCILLWL